MPKLSNKSRIKLDSCHADLKRLAEAVAIEAPISVICGYRGKAEQETAFREGKSKARFGQSKHNSNPAEAVDIVPLPLDWNDIESFEQLGAIIQKKADELGVKVKWGKYFTNLKDYPHWELV
ncbi:MAG: hypothetical protein K2N67_00825 [Mucispirillum sp.]|nr:hypothetical protein [Mucispirillum sp.]